MSVYADLTDEELAAARRREFRRLSYEHTDTWEGPGSPMRLLGAFPEDLQDADA